jgi:hypothetical protein
MFRIEESGIMSGFDADILIRRPAAAYLARLSPSERRVMRPALDAIATLLTSGGCINAVQYDWSSLTRLQTTAVRAVLADKHYAPSTANRYLLALREVLKECRRLGQISDEVYQRAVDLEPFPRLTRADAMAALAQQHAATTNAVQEARTDSRGGQAAAASYLARVKPVTRIVARSAFDIIAGILTNGRCTNGLQFDWAVVDSNQTQAIRTALTSAPYARSTARQYMTSLRGVLKECLLLGYLSVEAYRRAIDLEPIAADRQPRGRALDGCWDAPHLPLARRDEAILAVRRGAALSLAAVAGLDLSDYDRPAGSLSVRGQRQEDRSVILRDDGRAALEAWIEIRGVRPGPLFRPVLASGRLVVSRRLSQTAVADAVRRRAAASLPN